MLQRLLPIFALIMMAYPVMPSWAQAQPTEALQPAPATGNLSLKPAEDEKGKKILEVPSGNVSDMPPDQIPDILLEEMKEIETSCNRNYFYSSFQDCRCIAVKYLDERAKNDPHATKDSILRKVAAQCPDIVSVAGFIYKNCADLMSIHRPDDYLQFCRCAANQVAEDYGERPMVNLRYIERLRKNAFLQCGMMDNKTYKAKPAK